MKHAPLTPVRKRFAALFLVFTLAFTMFIPISSAVADDPLDLMTNLSTNEVLHGNVDSAPLAVQHYVAPYEANPAPVVGTNRPWINIYVPENATKDSAIIFLVNNSGWMSNAFPTNTIVNNFNYTTAGSNPNKIGMALKNGYVVVSYGCRSNNQALNSNNEWDGHSPATMTDTKAAIRYLRYNAQYITANTNRIVITGTSGGGALSVIIAASGNSPDYYESLYAVGAAGITTVGDTYASTPGVGDDIFATIAYCPITDLPMADQAYEWTYNAARAASPNNTQVNYNNLTPLADNPVMAASAWLASQFPAYIDGLGLKDENGVLLKATYTPPTGDALAGSMGGTYRDAMQRLLEKGINKAIYERNVGSTSADAVDNLNAYPWITVNANGVASINDLEAHLLFVAGPSALRPTQPILKIAPAFDNRGIQNAGTQNESSLVGRKDQQWSHWEEWSWNHATSEIQDVGQLNTGLSFDQFLQTPDGQLVAKQAKMMTPIPYLVGAEKMPYLKYAATSNQCDVAPYWYVRHGLADRDTSFAVGTTLYYALLNNKSVKDVNFNFAWLKAHSGDYDVAEAYEWLGEVLENANALDNLNGAMPSGVVTNSFAVPADDAISYSSNSEYAYYQNGQIVIVQPPVRTPDALVTLTVTVASDKTAGDGVNYGKINAATRSYSFIVPALTVLKATPSAAVEKLTGNKNNLTITVVEQLSNGTTNKLTTTIAIDNNAAGAYDVNGIYKVYVDTKGNDQIRDCHIL